MGFADRAMEACMRAMESGTVSDRHVRDVLKCRCVNVQLLSRYLLSDYSLVRRMAARIIGAKGGHIGCVLDAALKEEEKDVLIEMLNAVGKRGEGLEALERLLNHKDSLIKEEAISMFRRAGRAKLLFPLLFDEDDLVVKRIKRYINEQERQSRENACS